MLPYPVTLPTFVDRRTRILRWSAVGIVVAAAGAWQAFRRVEVVGSSMAPTLMPGDRLVVMGRRWAPPAWPKPGQVIAVRDPRNADRMLIKRVRAVDRPGGTLEVEGDAPDASTDSRSFGPVPRSSIVGRAVYRYAPAARSGPGPWLEEYDQA